LAEAPPPRRRRRLAGRWRRCRRTRRRVDEEHVEDPQRTAALQALQSADEAPFELRLRSKPRISASRVKRDRCAPLTRHLDEMNWLHVGCIHECGMPVHHCRGPSLREADGVSYDQTRRLRRAACWIRSAPRPAAAAEVRTNGRRSPSPSCWCWRSAGWPPRSSQGDDGKTATPNPTVNTTTVQNTKTVDAGPDQRHRRSGRDPELERRA
jgi:hypothetical protein